MMILWLDYFWTPETPGLLLALSLTLWIALNNSSLFLPVLHEAELPNKPLYSKPAMQSTVQELSTVGCNSDHVNNP